MLSQTAFDGSGQPPLGVVLRGVGQINNYQNRYEFQGKESEKTFGLNRINLGARTMNPTIGRMDRVDRFADKYLGLSTYQYAGNNPIKFIDVNGDSLTAGNIATVFFGLVGVIGSGWYMVASGGVGAVAGGTAAMTLSWGEVVMGIGQMAETKDEAMQKSGTIPGYITRKAGGTEEAAEVADAVGGLLPGIMTGGFGSNIRGITGVKSAITESKTLTGKAFEAASFADSFLDVGQASITLGPYAFVYEKENIIDTHKKYPVTKRIVSNAELNQVPYAPKRLTKQDSSQIVKFINSL